MDQTTAVLVTFARPEESRAFRRLLQRSQTRSLSGANLTTGELHGVAVSVLHTGIGPALAARLIQSILYSANWSSVVIAGFSGGLYPSLGLADIINEEVTGSGMMFIISRDLPVETAAEKAALHRATGAWAVDMETETIAAACRKAGLPATAIRAISDRADTDLPVPFARWFDASRQRARPFSLLGFLVRHPSKVAPFARFVASLPRVARSLAGAIERHIGRIASGQPA